MCFLEKFPRERRSRLGASAFGPEQTSGDFGVLRRRHQILVNNPGMACGDSEECKRRAIRFSAALLPVPQRVDTDFQRPRKFSLAQSHEVPERNDVIPRGQFATNQTSSKASTWSSSGQGEATSRMPHSADSDCSAFGTKPESESTRPIIQPATPAAAFWTKFQAAK